MKIYENIVSAIGSTPLVRLPFKSAGRIYAKLEYLNPGGSIKDRAAFWMIQEAERTGKLKPGGTIIEASSGNQGIAAAMIGAAKGYKVIITVSEKVSDEKKATFQAYGAQIIVCKPTTLIDDPEGYWARAQQIAKETPNSYMLNQYFNLVNMEAHYHLTGPEIWQQTHGWITHFCAAAGSGGTISGVSRYLKEQNSSIHTTCVDMDTSWYATKGHPTPYKAEGIGIDYKSPLLDEKAISSFSFVNDHDAIDMLNELATNHGLLVGPASGCAAVAAKRDLAPILKPNDLAVVMFTDSGRSYLTKGYYKGSKQ
jgi:cystathionine beta-synthase